MTCSLGNKVVIGGRSNLDDTVNGVVYYIYGIIYIDASLLQKDIILFSKTTIHFINGELDMESNQQNHQPPIFLNKTHVPHNKITLATAFT